MPLEKCKQLEGLFMLYSLLKCVMFFSFLFFPRKKVRFLQYCGRDSLFISRPSIVFFLKKKKTSLGKKALYRISFALLVVRVPVRLLLQGVH